CYLGNVESSEGPPHLEVVDEPAADAMITLPTVDRLTNETFQPMVLRGEKWHLVEWPAPLRLESIPHSSRTWFYAAERTWYLDQEVPK
ncbi:MAG: hypothetical protein R6X34_28230, partial [Chloroflexota bacterium]